MRIIVVAFVIQFLIMLYQQYASDENLAPEPVVTLENAGHKLDSDSLGVTDLSQDSESLDVQSVSKEEQVVETLDIRAAGNKEIDFHVKFCIG